MRSFLLVATPFLLSIASNVAGLAIRQANSSGTCTTNQRKAWYVALLRYEASPILTGLRQNLSDDEKAAYIDAELCLMGSPPQLFDWAKNRWDEVVYGHVVQSNVIHDVGAFLPWHRLYMRAHEYLLQTECNYTGAQP